MAKVESRCVLVPSSSVSLACIVGYLSSNRERERWKVSISLSNSERTDNDFFFFTSSSLETKIMYGIITRWQKTESS